MTDKFQIFDSISTGIFIIDSDYLVDEFYQDFKSVCIPFLDPDVYGRSILENSMLKPYHSKN